MIIALLLLAMFVYAGMWPPVYVVESASMQHSDDRSYLGVIDTGDLVIVQSSDGSGVLTYVDCYPDGHRSFGDYGDVIVYERLGSSEFTPIIHRAMLRLEYNGSSLPASFDAPSLADLPRDKWGNGGLEDGRWWNLTGIVEIYEVGYESALLRIDLHSLLGYYAVHGMTHDGFITMGDNNVDSYGGQTIGRYDQSASICPAPIMDEWIVGEAKAELPWLGLIKLWVNGNLPADTPENSKTGLIAVVVLLIAVPLAFDISSMVLNKKGIDPWARLKERLKRKKG